MIRLLGRRTFVTATAGAVAMIIGGSAIAQEYPSRPITFVVPWPAGGRTDIVGRIVASSIGSILGQPVAVVNRVGAGGSIGTKSVLDAEKDVYTVLVTTPGTRDLRDRSRAGGSPSS